MPGVIDVRSGKVDMGAPCPYHRVSCSLVFLRNKSDPALVEVGSCTHTQAFHRGQRFVRDGGPQNTGSDIRFEAGERGGEDEGIESIAPFREVEDVNLLKLWDRVSQGGTNW